VSSAPHSLPFANVTRCMRVSFESGAEMTSLCAGSAANSSRAEFIRIDFPPSLTVGYWKPADA